MSEELSGCSYCEAGKHDECVNALCDCSHRKSCGKTIREWQEICYRHNTVFLENKRLREELAAVEGNESALRARVSQAENHSSIAKSLAATYEKERDEARAKLAAMEKVVKEVVAYMRPTAQRMSSREGLRTVLQAYEDSILAHSPRPPRG